MPSTAKGAYFKLLNFNKSLVKVSMNIQFNKECLKYRIIPNYIKHLLNRKVTLQKTSARRIMFFCIRDEIRSLYAKKDRINRNMYMAHLHLARIVDNKTFDGIRDHMDECVNRLKDKLWQVHSRKFQKLLMDATVAYSPPVTDCDFEFAPRVCNLTNIRFSHNETQLLNKGLAYNTNHCPSESQIDSVVAHSISALEGIRLSTAQRNEVVIGMNRVILNTIDQQQSVTHQNPKISAENAVVRSINKKLEDNKSIIVRADKGKTAVVITEDEYVAKVQEFFIENKIERCKFDPTSKFVASLKKQLKLAKIFPSTYQKKALVPMNPSAPRLRAVIKVHKENFPARVIVNAKTGVMYESEKLLAKYLGEHYKHPCHYNIRNREHLISNLSQISIPPDTNMVSLDIKNMYASIPTNQVIDIIASNLRSHSNRPLEETTEVLQLLDLVLKCNYFKFGDQTYLQTQGLAMGSPLAYCLANIFMTNFEYCHVQQSPNHADKIIAWYRYVDDVFLLYNGSNRDCELFVNELNSHHDQIKFTIEHNVDGTLPYLDLNITLKDSTFSYDIYRKPSTTDTLLHQTSNHPEKYKKAAFRAFLYRLHKVPLSPEAFNREYRIIQYLAFSNGYSSDYVARINKEVIKKLRKNPPSTPSQKDGLITLVPTVYDKKLNYHRIPYFGVVSDRIGKQLKKKNIIPAFFVPRNVGASYRHKEQSKINQFKGTGVYEITCNDCPQKYIGQTGRGFDVRFKEHFSLKNSKSALTAHLRETGHSLSSIENNLKVIHKESKGNTLNILEEIQIIRSLEQSADLTLNNQTELKHRSLLANLEYLSVK